MHAEAYRTGVVSVWLGVGRGLYIEDDRQTFIFHGNLSKKNKLTKKKHGYMDIYGYIYMETWIYLNKVSFCGMKT